MITKDDPYVESAANSVYGLNQDWVAMEMCRRREDELASFEYCIKQKDKEIDAIKAEKDAEVNALKAEIEKLKAQIGKSNT